LAEDGSGGGICFDYGSTAVINCTITGNIADYYGGGISCRFSSPTIIGCTISNNVAYGRGGGIDSGLSEPNISNCVITGNYAPVGGGINCYYTGITNVVNCTIVANSVDYIGGAVYCQYEGEANIINSILWANIQQLGLEYEGSMSVEYCNVQGGKTDVYDPCGLLVWGTGNTDIDPCFVTFEPDGNPNLWDFHLISSDGRWNSTFYKVDLIKDGIINLMDFARLASMWMQEGILAEDLDNNGAVDTDDLGLLAQYYLVNRFEGGWISDEMASPCIDAGDPNSDWSDEPWPNGKRINMGAYGGTNQASKNGNLADFDVDGAVDLSDLMEFSSEWLDYQGGIVNLDLTGCVDFQDFAILAENWLWQRE
jgi:parallel beta-helix repeat protein